MSAGLGWVSTAIQIGMAAYNMSQMKQSMSNTTQDMNDVKNTIDGGKQGELGEAVEGEKLGQSNANFLSLAGNKRGKDQKDKQSGLGFSNL